METLTVGCKAYLDSFSGLVPCKVLAITRGNGLTQVQVKLTATRCAYKCGEILTDNSLHVVPRGAVHVRGGQYRIRLYSVA